MAFGNTIVLSGYEACGKKFEGIIATSFTPKPGTAVQINAVYGRQGGKYTVGPWDRGADGDHPQGPLIILTEDILQGKTTADAYAASDRAFGFIPWAGCQMNVLLKDVTGTGTTSNIALNDLLIVDDTTGKFIQTTGTPESEPFMALEASTMDNTDSLIHAIYTGY